jgi:hypothetical protein
MKKTTMKKSRIEISKSEVDRMRRMVPTINELRIIDLMRDYRAIRKNYFGRSIPPVEEVLLRFVSRKELDRLAKQNEREVIGISLWGKYLRSPAPKIVLLADDLEPKEIRITLLHEMAHLKVDIKYGQCMGHGKIFEKELDRLRLARAYDGWM